jgi:hypothetical protein
VASGGLRDKSESVSVQQDMQFGVIIVPDRDDWAEAVNPPRAALHSVCGDASAASDNRIDGVCRWEAVAVDLTKLCERRGPGIMFAEPYAAGPVVRELDRGLQADVTDGREVHEGVYFFVLNISPLLDSCILHYKEVSCPRQKEKHESNRNSQTLRRMSTMDRIISSFTKFRMEFLPRRGCRP